MKDTKNRPNKSVPVKNGVKTAKSGYQKIWQTHSLCLQWVLCRRYSQ